MKSDFETWREGKSESERSQSARDRERESEREKFHITGTCLLFMRKRKEGGSACIWPAKIDFSREPIIHGVFERKVFGNNYSNEIIFPRRQNDLYYITSFVYRTKMIKMIKRYTLDFSSL